MRARNQRIGWLMIGLFMASTFILWPMAIRATAEQLKFAHTMSITDTMQQGVLKFAELVKKNTGSALEITLYPAGQLGNDTQILQGVRTGAIDIAMTGNPFHAAFEPSLNVLDLPYLFLSFDHVYRVCDGEIFQQLLKGLEKHGIKGLGALEIGFRNLTNSKRPVREPADVRGLKIRTTPNPAHVTAWKLLGAIPTPMPFPDVYMALKTGTVDGEENPVTLIHGQKFYEVQKYLSLTMHAYTVAEVDMNLAKYQSLSPTYQRALIEALREATLYHRKLNRELEGSLLREMEQKGLVITYSPDKEAFAKIVQKPTQEEYAQKFGWEIIERINKAK